MVTVLTAVTVLMSVMVLKPVTVLVPAADVMVTVEAGDIDADRVTVDAEATGQVDPEALVIVTVEVAAAEPLVVCLDILIWRVSAVCRVIIRRAALVVVAHLN